MDQAFAAIWNDLKADDPFRDYANDSELPSVNIKARLHLGALGGSDDVLHEPLGTFRPSDS